MADVFKGRPMLRGGNVMWYLCMKPHDSLYDKQIGVLSLKFVNIETVSLLFLVREHHARLQSPLAYLFKIMSLVYPESFSLLSEYT
jgi:hypothetical protein